MMGLFLGMLFVTPLIEFAMTENAEESSIEFPEQPAYDAEEADQNSDEESEEDIQANVRQMLETAKNNPERADLENYDKDTFATMGMRFKAYLLDCLVTMPTVILIAWALGTFPTKPAFDAVDVGLFGLSGSTARVLSSIQQILLYSFAFGSVIPTWAGTWGTKYNGLLILNRDFTVPTKISALFRSWTLVISIMFGLLGIISGFFHKKRRMLHDQILGTYVVRWKQVPITLVRAKVIERDGFEVWKKTAGKSGDMNTFTKFFLLFFPGILIWALGLALFKRKNKA